MFEHGGFIYILGEKITTVNITEHVHTDEVIPAVPASCSESGLPEDIYCSVCHEVVLAQEVVPALGHQYEDCVCTVCGHQTTQGLVFAINDDGTSYSVSDIGTAIDTDISIPSTYNGLPVTSIGYSAFSDCTSLTSVEIPNSVTSIDNAAFFYCSSLTSVEIPNSVTNIGINAFANCSSLTRIKLPSHLINIDISAFKDCSSYLSEFSKIA